LLLALLTVSSQAVKAAVVNPVKSLRTEQGNISLLRNNIMIRNSIKIAWRNLRRYKSTSLINIGGLALGICCFLLLGTYVVNELRLDRFHEKADRIVHLSFAYKTTTDAEFTEAAVTPTAAV